MNRIELRRWVDVGNVAIRILWGIICYVSSGGWAQLAEDIGGIGYPFRFFLFVGLYVSLDVRIHSSEDERDP